MLPGVALKPRVGAAIPGRVPSLLGYQHVGFEALLYPEEGCVTVQRGQIGDNTQGAVLADMQGLLPRMKGARTSLHPDALQSERLHACTSTILSGASAM